MLGRIRIINTPGGQAPLSVREKWVGVEIDCLYSTPSNVIVDIYTHEIVGYMSGFVVLQADALSALAKLDAGAAAWWKSNGYPRSDIATFIFDDDCALVVKKPLTKASLTGELN